MITYLMTLASLLWGYNLFYTSFCNLWDPTLDMTRMPEEVNIQMHYLIVIDIPFDM